MIVILTALNLEYQAVRRHLTGLETQAHAAGTLFEVGRLPSGGRVALCLAGKGNQSAAVLTERAIARFTPSAVLFVGVAGGLYPSIKLGDVVVASKVYAYHGGTAEDDGMKARPRAWDIPHAADQLAQHLDRTGEWTRHLPPGVDVPAVRFAPIAAGEVVQDSATSAHARWVRDHFNDALAIEMEGAGVVHAAFLNSALPGVVVRGISDRADGTKQHTDGQNWQPHAAANAAAFAIALADELARAAHIRTVEHPGSSAMLGSNENVAKGNARVGVQAGIVFGGIQQSPGAGEPGDVLARIDELRTQLRRAQADDRLDEHTYKAAEAELTIAADSLATGAAGERGTGLVALKRLRGLVIDLSDLAAGVAAVIALVQGLS
ncbi:5'-methylthioadenosine/S-adenosylhomocysteine nucleosidase family protein [Catenuloplanes indicus]|uniref:8-oxo-dGTP diphosphatase n=1 Tax=Catenuloplanes indicus TaxID=137267 RepID=A0AAE4AXJ5_9ACTN|nr:5'-methylthioadenosine/S-adenosylhomocysteine nucleosidase [Catenuloplanes indicus]MDQ0367095.1 8-oxo-dGTP diphosphatase [Catenuloplanes indicus]